MTSRDDFERSLGRTAANLPGAFVDKAVGDTRRRCELLSKAKGGFFEEGGGHAAPCKRTLVAGLRLVSDFQLMALIPSQLPMVFDLGRGCGQPICNAKKTWRKHC